MKRISKLLFLITLLFGQKGFADCCDPCFKLCDLSYSVYADYLYWKVTKPEFSTIFDATENLFAPSPYSSGYRVGAAVFYNCFDFDARYTYLHTSFENTVTLLSSGFQEFTYQLRYRTLDLTLGYTNYFLCYRAYIKPFLGAKLAWLNEYSTELFTGQFRTFRVTTNGYGPMLGLESSWELFRCWMPISLIARGDFSVLHANSFYKSTDNLITPTTATFPRPLSSFPFVADFYIGLGMDLCNCSRFAANIQVGYEAQAWMNMRAMRSATGNLGTLSLGGLVVHANVMF